MKIGITDKEEEGNMLKSSKAKAGAARTLLKIMVAGALLGGSVTGCGKTEDPQTLIADAKRYEEKGDHNAAIIQLKNALQKDPDDAEARHFLGTVYNETGDSASAEKELRKALSLGMSPDKVIPELGQTLLSMGQFQQVMDETSKLPEDKRSAEILTLRGNASLALGSTEEAKEWFERALRITHNYPGALIG